jgi:hypothetical protein
MTTTPDTKIGARLRARLSQLLAENSRVPTLYEAYASVGEFHDHDRERPREQAWNAAFGHLRSNRRCAAKSAT